MSDPHEDLLRRPLYVYDLPPNVLDTLTVKPDDEAASCAVNEDDTSPSARDVGHSASSDGINNLVGSQSCSLCAQTFATLEDQRSHQKSDLHRYNLKQKLRGLRPVSEVEFEKLIGDLDESLSGSDSDDSEDDEDDDSTAGKHDSTLAALLRRQARLADKAGGGGGGGSSDDGDPSPNPRTRGKPPILWFSSPLLPEKHYFGMYRAILTGEEQRRNDLVETLRTKQLEPISIPKPAKDGSMPEVAYTGPHIFLCMIGGGHFAAMVVSLAPRPGKGGATTMNREATVLAHKTFHRYTTRRKQGGSQSANDNAKGNAHSAGSGLRRYNEQALVQDVRNLLEDWKGLIDTSELLFIRATGATNRRTLFGPYDGQVLRHNDTRLRGFPFSTRRATQNELMRSFIELTRLKVREIDPAKEPPKDAGKPPSTTAAKSTGQQPAKPKFTEEEETALLHTSQLQAFIRRSKLPALLSYLRNNSLSPDFEFQPPEQNHHGPRPLHLAASQNSAPLVLGLLTRAGADPTIRNNEGKAAFELAGDRATRDAFRVARSELGEEKWSWDTGASVPAPMTKAEADSRDERERKEASEKEAERRRAEEERLRAAEEPAVVESKNKAKARANALAAGLIKTPQERREEEARGMTPEMRMRLERERRARAAEARLKKMQGGGG
ncbi:VMS1 -like protein [Hapsidospora chrysogenum ATCC 11550]|uniref:VMS1-like protein n=1 Tax=Hapsidospora chrysogenum (strain ATCC 11550 / CBS 779.69 / DSM 880 / IAM 14645 / JCM 23072 / IMI 49137) TaxID=857340 RepID=A0A086T080_HAPC1|nr:VMS1 -like protein [Hapsidospora chrysogenum ATCC 11550]